MKRAGALAVAAVATIAVVGVGVAWATFTPTVLYKPPVIKALDHSSHSSVENVEVRRVDSNFTFNSSPAPFVIDPGSDPGCDNDAVVSCPKAGVKKIVVLLGALNDSADIRLGASADKVKQIVKGQDGEDELVGGKGIQKLSGGDQNDTLIGGPGPDILIGGQGEDICDGGSGHDEFISCEAAPVR